MYWQAAHARSQNRFLRNLHAACGSPVSKNICTCILLCQLSPGNCHFHGKVVTSVRITRVIIGFRFVGPAFVPSWSPPRSTGVASNARTLPGRQHQTEFRVVSPTGGRQTPRFEVFLRVVFLLGASWQTPQESQPVKCSNDTITGSCAGVYHNQPVERAPVKQILGHTNVPR